MARAHKSLDEVTGADIEGINIPIVYEDACTTILPLFSQDAAPAPIPQDQVPDLNKKVQDAGTVVVAPEREANRDTVDSGFHGELMNNAFASEKTGLCARRQFHSYTATKGTCMASSPTAGITQGSVAEYKDVFTDSKQTPNVVNGTATCAHIS